MAKRMKQRPDDRVVRSIRNRGEEKNEFRPNMDYDYMPQSQYDSRSQERAIRRFEARDHYREIYELEQRRDQRDFERTKEMENEFFAGVDPRRRSELAQGGMVREDHKAMANLPKQAIHCEYPQAGFYETPYLDALVRGIDESPDDDGTFKSRHVNDRMRI